MMIPLGFKYDDGGRQTLRVLIACEFSGIVREAFRQRGHDAWSADLLPAEDNSPFHLQGDVRQHFITPFQGAAGYPMDRWLTVAGIATVWDLMIAFPPCTHLASSGARWFAGKSAEQATALAFVRELMNAPIPRIALENPIGVISTQIRKPDQIIQPWQFGHGETKATCLWLKGLPLLRSTKVVPGRHGRVWREPPSPDRWKRRSRTYQGIAAAMAEQWGDL